MIGNERQSLDETIEFILNNFMLDEDLSRDAVRIDSTLQKTLQEASPLPSCNIVRMQILVETIAVIQKRYRLSRDAQWKLLHSRKAAETIQPIEDD